MQRKLQELGLTWGDALFVSLFVADMSEFAKVNAVYSRILAMVSPPARCCVQVR